MTYSYTQIGQYLRCPRSYRYRYLDGRRKRILVQQWFLVAALRLRWVLTFVMRIVRRAVQRMGCIPGQFP